ncbi:DUF3024 domain-containing protein [Rhodococcus sp. T7]|uniref:DUF3024 domain-containing protein n=1 Tax=Rhodococcus sp. T7 TaxID=627444 RepID=UPI0013CB296D|nr:DUF3024 domain-containing protein [Rhodococcus sp. T7]KAF0957432.1 hypothetical protein MLGJGCBP_09264 [Rhodococcus sp. T7]KAF0962097.1 hypothetical protein MLGJGCBP_04718 [Rhodococcus sp. T7]
MLVTDLRHFLDLPDEVPGPARRLAEQLYDLVRAATAGDTGTAWVSALPCRRRPGNRRCTGRMLVLRAATEGPIASECNTCGDAGRISDWEGSPFDLRRAQPTEIGPVHHLRIPDEVATTLRGIMLLDTDCERVAFRAYVDGDDTILPVPDTGLEELIGYVAADANHEPNRRRQQRLDAAFTVLSEAAENPHSSPSALVPAGDSTGAVPPRPGPAVPGLPELDIARVQRWCGARVPEHARHEVRLECEIAARHLTIVERRAPWCDDVGTEWTSMPIARLRYTKATKTWSLYWRDRNLRFHTYDRLPPSPHLETLLTELDRDPTCMFWG